MSATPPRLSDDVFASDRQALAELYLWVIGTVRPSCRADDRSRALIRRVEIHLGVPND